jgi:hypothetical protein
MSADPFENTTTVKNILQHIISPKIVSDGATGYIVRTDLVNVHNLVFANGATTENGSPESPFTTQCGTANMLPSSGSVTVYHSRITNNSIIITNYLGSASNSLLNGVILDGANKRFTISSTGPPSFATPVGWFIAKF